MKLLLLQLLSLLSMLYFIVCFPISSCDFVSVEMSSTMKAFFRIVFPLGSTIIIIVCLLKVLNWTTSGILKNP